MRQAASVKETELARRNAEHELMQSLLLHGACTVIKKGSLEAEMR